METRSRRLDNPEMEKPAEVKREVKSESGTDEELKAPVDTTVAMLLKYMMQQDERRREEQLRLDEQRREEQLQRDEQRREEQLRLEEERREEQKRRQEEENRRWEWMMKSMRISQADNGAQGELLGHVTRSPPGSISSSMDNVPDFQKIKRKVDRWEGEIADLVEELKEETSNGSLKEVIQNLCSRLKRYDTKLSQALDESIDCLDGDEDKDQLMSRVNTLIRNVNQAETEGTMYVNKLLEIERERAKAGPLPVGTEPPKFDGNVLHYQQWWDHFRSLVHENRSVGKFWKMRYLLKALEGTAASILSGKKGLENEYDESIQLVQKRYGKEHTVVRHLVNAIVSGPSPSKDAQSFGTFIEEVKTHLSALDSHKASRDMVVLSLLENRLPTSVRMDWEREVCSLIDEGKVPATNDLIKFLEVEHEAICAKTLVKSEKAERKGKDEPRGATQKEKVTSAQSLVTVQRDKQDIKKKRRCLSCKGEHTILECKMFKSKDHEERRKIVNEKKLCFKCLKTVYYPWHRCKVDKCDKCQCFHHEMISCPPQKETEETEESSSLATIANEGNEVLPTVLAKARVGRREVTVRLGLDSMSQKTFITSSASRKLGLKASGRKTVSVQGFGGISTKEKFDTVEIELFPTDGGRSITIGAFVKNGPICAPLKAVKVKTSKHPHLRGLVLGDPNIPDGAEIDVLIGQAPLQEILLGEIIRPRGGGRQPSAWKTRFGYALMGPLPEASDLPETESQEVTSLFVDVQPLYPDTSLEMKVEKFWNVDSLGILDTKILSAEEERAVDIMEKNTTYDGECYTVPLPFKEDAPKLVNNYERVRRQLEATERRLLKDPQLMQQYTKAMKDYETRGFARALTEDEIKKFDDGEQYFIPHHAVMKETSVSTKCRVVFNASDCDKNGNSLNSCLLPGPALQPDLGGVLLRFRMHPIALSGDIEKMFLQTQILPEYYPYQQYLWRDCNRMIEPSRMVMTRLMFGVSFSPYGAIGTTHRHAGNERMQQLYPDVCQKVKTSLYVDDWQNGGDSEEEVIRQYRDTVNFFKAGGWRLTKFASNSSSVLKAIPEADRHPHAVIDFDQRDEDIATPTALGVNWDTQKDCFLISVSERMVKIPEVLTKRIILSMLSSVYDVFGFLAAYLIKAKILMQVIWRLGVTWDETLPDDIQKQFLKWAEELRGIRSIPIRRYMLHNRKNKRLALHGFCDASEKAYGAIIYLTYEDTMGEVQTTFVMSKTRVAPLKSQTVARLELMGALVLAKLMTYVLTQLTAMGPASPDVEEVYLWSDSEIALAWIRKPSSQWKQFVRNRVQQIQELFDVTKWHHCPGKENPADMVSRGITLKELQDNELYWHGPPWLKLAANEWPDGRSHDQEKIEQSSSEDAVELSKEKAVTVMSSQVKTVDPPPRVVTRSSKYLKTKRVLAWMLRFTDRLAGQTISGELTADELKRAETGLLRDLQRRHFEVELHAVRDEQKIPSKSPLLNYDPAIQEETGLLVVGGRLQNSELPYSVQHPIILPDRDVLTEQIVDDLHVRGQHAAIETTLSLVRQHYHIVHAREVVRKVVRRCVVCRYHQTKPATQKMGSLPAHRVTPAPAFTDVGLDFTGALQIRDGSTVQKGYICVFTCSHSRMIHLELTPDMTTESFLQALRRFMNRRGWCRSIESDNQTTFKKAKKILEVSFMGRKWENMKKSEIEQFMANNGIVWRFITERSPFRGGYWERLNRSLKDPLRKVLGNALLSYTELYTVLTDIEAALNQRPLGYHSSDPGDPAPITPSQLALGRNLKEVPPVKECGIVTVGKRYKYLQRLLSQFWKRWTTEYLPKLQIRTKWQQQEEPLCEGDVVLVTEDNTTRPKWPMGIITETFKGRDGLIRTAKVKTRKGYFIRPVSRLHLLEKADADVHAEV